MTFLNISKFVVWKLKDIRHFYFRVNYPSNKMLLSETHSAFYVISILFYFINYLIITLNYICILIYCAKTKPQAYRFSLFLNLSSLSFFIVTHVSDGIRTQEFCILSAIPCRLSSRVSLLHSESETYGAVIITL